MQTLSNQIYRNPLPCRSWRTTNQIIIFTLILSLITICIAITISYIAIYYASSYLRNLSERVSDNQTENELLTSSYYQLRYTKSYFRSGIQTLSSINDLYQYVQNRNISLESPTECFTPLNNPIALSCPQFCFARFEPELKNEDSEQYIYKLTSIMNLYASVYDLTKLTYFVSNEDSQYAAAYNYTMPISYRPHNRSWYLDHLKAISTQNSTKQLYRLTDPFIHYVTKAIMVTETMSLLKTNGSFDGVSAQNSNFPHIPQTQDSYAQPLIVDSNGYLLTNQINGVTTHQISLIYTTNQTGFTKEDWEDLKSISQENFFGLTKIFNQIKQEYVQISAIKLNSYYLFLYVDDKHFRKTIDRIIQSIDNFYQEINAQFFITGTYTLVGVILIQIIAIKFIFLKDLRKLFIIAEKQILKHSVLFTQFKVQESSSEIRQLFISYYKALNNLSNSGQAQKNEKCKILELLKYPTQFKQKDCKRFFQRIKTEIYKISNSKSSVLCQQQKALFLIILKCCRQCFGKNFDKHQLKIA